MSNGPKMFLDVLVHTLALFLHKWIFCCFIRLLFLVVDACKNITEEIMDKEVSIGELFVAGVPIWATIFLNQPVELSKASRNSCY